METHNPTFVFIANNAAVDFVNTEIINRGTLTDLLQDGASLVCWAQEAGIAIKSELTGGDLSTAKKLRSALKELFQAKIEKRPASQESLDTVNRHLRNHATHKVLQVNRKNGDYALVPDEDASSAAALLANLAYSGAVLLASPQATQLKHCSNPDCVLIFLDTSRNQKRRWCSMDTCGNRAKVAKHYRKQVR